MLNHLFTKKKEATEEAPRAGNPNPAWLRWTVFAFMLYAAYTMYQKEKIGKVNLQFCVNISCWLNGAEKLVHCAEKRLGIKCGETTKDGKFTISEAECLAACGTAPAMMINEDYFESLDVPQLNTLLDQANKDLDAGKEVGKSTQTPGVWP